MILPNREIKRIIFATLLSLSIYAIVTQLIDWGSENCPWETKKTKFIVMVIVATVSLYMLFFHFKNVANAKAIKHALKYGSNSSIKSKSVSAPAS